jgi:protein TonB
MFEHYLQHQAPDSRRRWRVALALNLAGFATAGLVGFTWLMDKLMIAQVAPPTASYVMVQMSMEEVPPPPPPPAAPPARSEPEVERIPDEDPLAPPDLDEVVAPKPKASKFAGNGLPDSKGTAAIGVRTNVPGIPGMPPGIPGFPPNIGVATRKDAPSTSRPPVPISAVFAQAIYAPPPDQHKLAGTRAAMFDKRPGENETAFCVDPDGRTSDVRTVKRFPGDPKVDEICRDTVKKWRFKPFIVGGKPVKTCSVAEFNLKFT